MENAKDIKMNLWQLIKEIFGLFLVMAGWVAIWIILYKEDCRIAKRKRTWNARHFESLK